MSHKIHDHLDTGLVIFCGAGLSMVPPTCLPSWWQLNEQVVQALAHQIVPFCGEEYAADLAKQINTRRDNRRFPPEFQAEIISNHYGQSYFKVLECLDSDEPNSVHLAIAELAKLGYIHAIVTPNFDRLIEVAFMKLNVPLQVHYQNQHFEKLAKEFEESPHNYSQCLLLKLHGSVEDHHTLIDTLSQRMRGLSLDICSCLRHLLHNHYWLFMGYSGGDLEANPHYLCLEAEARHAKGFSWLVRNTAKNEPSEAVTRIGNLYGNRFDVIRGELPAWFFEQFGMLLPVDFQRSSFYSSEELSHRKQTAEQLIINHTREWSSSLGGVRSAIIIAEMLDKSVSNPQAAGELLTMILNTLNEDDQGYTAICENLADIYYKSGKLEEAIKLVEKAISITSTEKINQLASLKNIMGLIQQKQGQYHQALENFQQTLEYFTQLNDQGNISVALHNIAMTLGTLGLYDQARDSYEQELEILRKLGNAFGQAQALNNIGNLLRLQDNYSEAVNILNQSINLRERLGDDRGIANSLGNIAAALLSQGDYNGAKTTFEKVLRIFRSIGDKSGEVTTMYNLGSAFQELHNFTEAEQKFKNAMEIAIECGLEPERAHGLWKLASLYRTTNRNSEASQLLDEALVIYQHNGDKNEEAEVLNEIGILLLDSGHLDEATTRFKQAIVIREQLNQLSGLCIAIGNLALVHIKKQDLDNSNNQELDNALDLLIQNLSIAERINSRSLIANAHYNIGALEYRKGEINQALNSFYIAQRLFQEIGHTYKAIDALLSIGIIYSEEDIDNGLPWFDQAIQIATGIEHSRIISERLKPIFELLLQNDYEELVQKYQQQLMSIGV